MVITDDGICFSRRSFGSCSCVCRTSFMKRAVKARLHKWSGHLKLGLLSLQLSEVS